MRTASQQREETGKPSDFSFVLQVCATGKSNADATAGGAARTKLTENPLSCGVVTKWPVK